MRGMDGVNSLNVLVQRKHQRAAFSRWHNWRTMLLFTLSLTSRILFDLTEVVSFIVSGFSLSYLPLFFFFLPLPQHRHSSRSWCFIHYLCIIHSGHQPLQERWTMTWCWESKDSQEHELHPTSCNLKKNHLWGFCFHSRLNVPLILLLCFCMTKCCLFLHENWSLLMCCLRANEFPFYSLEIV